jgi:hypothetical protein
MFFRRRSQNTPLASPPSPPPLSTSSLASHHATPRQHTYGIITHKTQDEFAAHASAVNCLRIGRKSAGVLVTGGEDRKVNVWAIGKPAAILVRCGFFVMCGMLVCCRARSFVTTGLDQAPPRERGV